MKRLLALAMCVALVMTSFVFVSASTDATLTVATVEGPIAAGEEVAIPVTITEWANAYATIELTFDYDETLLTLDGIEASEDDFGGAMAASNENNFALVCNPSSERQAKKLLGGEVCVLYFIAATDINVSAAVTVDAYVNGYAQGKDDNWTATQTLELEVVDGGVYVEDDDGGDLPDLPDSVDATLTVATVDGPFAAGDEIAIPVTITEWANAYATIELTFDYDETLLTLDGIEASEDDFRGAMAASNENHFALVCNPSSQKQADKVLGGEVCVLYFIAKTDINVSTNVTISNAVVNGYAQGADDNWTETQALGLEIVDGGVYVEGSVTPPPPAVCTHENTEVKDAAEATCGKDGYTGDIYCVDCGEKVVTGEVVPATGNHVGGTATCIQMAECTVCGLQYGDADFSNHPYGTEIRNASENYTGDTYCLACDTMIAQGKYGTPGYVVVTDATGKQGDEVTVTVSLGENTALAAYIAILEFDETALELVKMTRGDFCATVNKTTKKANGFNSVDITEGSLFSATFKILATTGSYEVGVNFTNAVTADFSSVIMNVTGGNISVGECEHETLSEIKYNETHHWYECNTTVGCGVLVNEALHEGGEATCNAKAICDVCGVEYGELDATNHGETEIRDASETYTGDMYCLDCDKIIARGQYGTPGYAVVTDASGKQGDEVTITVSLGEDTAIAGYGATLEYDETALELVDMRKGSFCAVVNKNNGKAAGHAFDNVTSGTLFTATFKILAEKGDYKVNVVFDNDYTAQIDGTTVIMNVTGGNISVGKCEHETLSEIQYNETYHWYECNTTVGCGVIVNEAPHEGGTATCKAKAECTVCGAEYGELDTTNHGETEIRGAKDAICVIDGYTGDTYCLDCGEIVAYGEVVPATGNHVGGTATCNAKAECTDCGAEYGELDTTNHVGGTEIRNASTSYTGDTYCLGCDEMIAEGEELATDSTITVGTVDGPVKAGQEIVVPITFGEWINGYATVEFELDYDEYRLELVSVDLVESVGVGVYNNNKFAAVFNPVNKEQANRIDGGVICEVRFKAITNINSFVAVEIKDLAVEGYTKGENDNWLEYRFLNVNAVNGGIKVDNPNPEFAESVITINTANSSDVVDNKIALPVTITQWANGYNTIEFELDYDATQLQIDYIELSKNNFKGAQFIYNGNKVTIICEPTSESEAQQFIGGEICVVHFTMLGDSNESISVGIDNVKVCGYAKGAEDNWSAGRDLDMGMVQGGISFGTIGDVNDDGEVNAIDAMVISQYYVGLVEAEDINLAVADVNLDGEINAIDAMVISQYYVGLVDSLPVKAQ